MIYNTDNLRRGFDSLGFHYDDLCIERFIKYYEMLIEWNEKINLTSITDYDDVVNKHFIDSVAVLKYCNIPSASKIIDVGTGAGFPGIPLKILRPDLDIMLVDSLNKRISFLTEVIRNLSLYNITATHGRAEELGHDIAFREKYDYCVSRAVADLSVLCEYSLSFVKPSGYFISYKSGDVDDEICLADNAIRVLSGSVEEVFRFILPDTDISRSLIIIRKDSLLDDRYPRSYSKIKKKRL